MEKEDLLTLLKCKLAEELEKQGNTLEDLEEVLKAGELNKEGEDHWYTPITNAIGGAAGMVGNAAKGVGGTVMTAMPEALIGTALVGGTTLGGLAYAANRHLNNQDKALNERQAEVERYKDITNRLKSDYGIN